jgi:hypothetical protein
MKLTEIIKSLYSYEKFLVEIEASNSKIAQIKNIIEFFSSYSSMTLTELDTIIKKNVASDNSEILNHVKKTNSKQSIENSDLLNAVKLYKKKVKGLKLNENESLFVDKFEANNPKTKNVVNLSTKELTDFFYSQNFNSWKVDEIKFVLLYFFGDIPISNKSKKSLIDVLQNQLFQKQYLDDLNNLNKK